MVPDDDNVVRVPASITTRNQQGGVGMSLPHPVGMRFTQHPMPMQLFVDAFQRSAAGPSYMDIVDIIMRAADVVTPTCSQNPEWGMVPFPALSDDHEHCVAPVNRPVPVMLATFPNSGTSWVLNLIRRASGIFKHTVYKKECSDVNGPNRKTCVRFSMEQQNSSNNESSLPRFVYAIKEAFDKNGPGRMGLAGEGVLVKSHLRHYKSVWDALNEEFADTEPLRDFAPQMFSAEVSKELLGYAGVVHLIRNPIDNIVSRGLRAAGAQSGPHVTARVDMSIQELHFELLSWVQWHLSLLKSMICSKQQIKYVAILYETTMLNPQQTTQTICSMLRWISSNSESESTNGSWDCDAPQNQLHQDSIAIWSSKYDPVMMPEDHDARQQVPLYVNFLPPWQVHFVGHQLKRVAKTLARFSGGNRSEFCGLSDSDISFLFNTSATSLLQATWRPIVESARVALENRDVHVVEVASTCTSTASTQPALDFDARLRHFVVFCCLRAPRMSVLHNIVQHPSVVPPRCAAPNFFVEHDVIEYNTTNKLRQLRELYVKQTLLPRASGLLSASGEYLTGEASMSYLYSSSSTALLLSTLRHDLKLIAVVQNPALVFAAGWLLPLQKHRGHLRTGSKKWDLPEEVLAFESKNQRSYSCDRYFSLYKSHLLRCVMAEIQKRSAHNETTSVVDSFAAAKSQLAHGGLRSDAVATCAANRQGPLTQGIFLLPLLRWFQAVLDFDLVADEEAEQLRILLSSFPDTIRRLRYEGSFKPKNTMAKKLSLRDLFLFVNAQVLFLHTSDVGPSPTDPTNSTTMRRILHFLGLNDPTLMPLQELSKAFHRRQDATDAASGVAKTVEVLEDYSRHGYVSFAYIAFLSWYPSVTKSGSSLCC